MGVVPALPFGRALTRADLEAMPDDGHRYELVDGVLVVSPSPRPLHQRAITRLIIALVASCPPELEVLPAPVDVVLADNTVIIPDVVVGRRTDFTERGLPVPPVLAIEVLSPSTRRVDLLLKRSLLEDAGCPNYWVVDPDKQTLLCWALRDGRYVVVASVSGAEVAELTEPFPVQVSPGALLRPSVPSVG